METFRTINLWIGWGLFFLAMLVYTLTIEPTASFWDCSEYIAAAYKLQVTHPPGAPLFLLIGRMFSFLAGNNPEKVAFWVNMSSAIASSATVMVVFWIISLLARRIIGKATQDLQLYEAASIWGAGIIGALSLTFCSTFWSNATEAETYACSTLLMSLTVWAMLNWEYTAPRPRSYQWLLLVAYLIGLSLGIRMFSVLTIPALCLIFYFKRVSKITLLGTTVTLLIGGILLAFIYTGITLSLPTCAMQLELLCVNQLGLPFKSGIIILCTTLIVSLTYGIIYTIKKQHTTIHIGLLCLGFILIGYSSYGLVPIRAHADPPINEGHPSDIISFINYLKREQYGHRPLVYGPHFAAQIISAKKGDPIYRNTGKKYEIIGYKHIPIYDAGAYTLLPRTWSQQNPMHITAYRKILNLKPWQKPSLGDQLYFLIRHQLGHFYLRYFLWNFAGRASDTQGASWLTPLDAFEKLPPSLTQIPGRSNYLFLPLLLGIIGMLFQYRHDRRYFWVITILFVMLGAALVTFLNPPPIEPRERDYIYVGSFLLFTIWIGLGTLAVVNYFRKLFTQYKIAVTIGIISCLAVPSIMATQAWQTHNRSQRYFSVESAKNLLASCASNAILFTAGDNDTFPLWYVQEVEGFRTDVRVVILSYANAAWYIKQLTRPVNNSAPLPLSLPFEIYQQYGLNDILPYVPQPNIQELDVIQYLQLIRESHPALQIQNILRETTNTLPCKNMCFHIDKTGIAAKEIVPTQYEYLIPEKMSWSIKGRGLDKRDLLILDLLATNNWERPIYFNHSSLHALNIDLSTHVMAEGLTLRLMPIQNNIGHELVNTETMYNNMMKSFYWKGMDKPGVYYDENYRLVFIRNQRMSFCTLAKACLHEGKLQQAKEVLLYGLSVIPDEVVPYDIANVYMIHLLFEVGENEHALNMIKIIGNRAEEILTYKTRKSSFVDREAQEQMGTLYEIARSLRAIDYQELAQEYEDLLNKYQILLDIPEDHNSEIAMH
ncbi:MAG: glycosyltransferase family 117 protein [Candidatus Amoebophilus sp.]